MVNHLFSNSPGAGFKCVYEAGFSGFWLQRELTEAGIDCIVAHPADIPTMDKEKKQKSEAIDSRKLSRSLKSEAIEGIYIPTVEIPNTHSSGEKDKIGRNTERGNRFLKYKIIKCARVAIRKDPGLLMYYNNQISRMEGNKAIIKVARRLLNRIKLVFTQEVKYQVG